MTGADVSALSLFAPAKINLGLSVLRVIPDGQPHAGAGIDFAP